MAIISVNYCFLSKPEIMKPAYLLLVLICFSTFSFYAQEVMSFEEAKNESVYPAVEEEYKSAVHADSTKAVFVADADVSRHIQAYQQFIEKLGAFLKEKGFTWDENVRCFNRIYINANGTIDYFLYHFKTKISLEKEEKFKALVKEYIKVNKFGITARENFSQCSPVVYPKSS